MPRPSLSLYTFAPVLAAFFALSAIVLLLTSRPTPTPRLSDLVAIETTVRGTSSGIGGTTLRVAVGGKDVALDAGTCAAFMGPLTTGDPVTVWVDKASRVWRLTRLARPLCTFAQSTVADASSRTTRRRIAMGLAIASVVCVGFMIVGRRQVQLIDDGSAA